MTKKEKNKLREKLEKVKRLLMILFMLASGIWYVTMGRAEDTASIRIYSEESDYDDKDVESDIHGITKMPEEGDILKKEKYDTEIKGSVSTSELYSQESETAESGEISSDISPQSAMERSSLVDLNKAGLQELESIPGVGPATAKNIIEYREKYGGFADIEEIKNVKRIGDKTFEKLKDHITV
ncbi:hypothetical protein BXO88_11625 [Oribacterium sp. C9]|uniref:ComEA family DNA-binding protein n=1 Tax=Oribacterium sp. C9 TaxID=1943579 RepID=UPI0009D58134|nr:helix-hairpin-helix domain-containing protein [Oribacterium sp. C9]OON85579.1 hypothetical protein BXO88_11625 [Oribacterium sp. C9]